MRYWVLRGHEAVETDDVREYGAQFSGEERKVGGTRIGEVYVSTVFIGIDMNYGGGPPLLFETMVFRGSLDQRQVRYSTWDEAERGHALVVDLVRLAEKEVDDIKADIAALEGRSSDEFTEIDEFIASLGESNDA